MVSPAADSRHSTAIVAHGIADTIDLVLIFAGIYPGMRTG